MTRDYRTAALDPPTRALLEYAERVTRTPDSVGAPDIDALRAVGLGEEQILEALHVTGLYNYLDRMADALGVEIDPQFRRG